MEGNGFRDRIQDFTAKNTVVIGVSCDPGADNKAFQQKFGFPYDLLSDADKSMSVSYGVDITDSGRTSRKSVLIGPDGMIVKTYATVKPAEHPDEVLNDLAALD
ncbi:MAG: peroxiredoxin [Novosphingobium sp.]|nr:peroxiredoxin [Novosphingobium sp.]MCC2099236.1 peroxiredoxin [Hyphomicrobiales bacterium]